MTIEWIDSSPPTYGPNCGIERSEIEVNENVVGTTSTSIIINVHSTDFVSLHFIKGVPVCRFFHRFGPKLERLRSRTGELAAGCEYTDTTQGREKTYRQRNRDQAPSIPNYWSFYNGTRRDFHEPVPS